MVLDAVLAVLHWWAVLAMFVALTIEMVRCRGVLDAAAVTTLGRRDAVYGALAGFVLVAGLVRAWLGVRGWEFYATNPVFWIKIGLFAVVGLMSLVPTVRFIRWRKETAAGGTIDAERTEATRWWIHAQLTVLILIPVAGALMARGIGFPG
jgi:putative membrane protein